MGRFFRCGCIVAAACGSIAVSGAAQPDSPIAGAWTLNRSLSEMPREIGFNMFPAPTADGRSGSTSGGRGRRGSTGGGDTRGASPFSARPESYDEAQRVQLLTTEARTPPARVTIVDTPAAVTLTNDLGQSRTVHPNGREESIEAQGVRLIATSRRDGERLIVDYNVAQGRSVRYTYSRSASAPQLVVEVEFLDHGSADKARRVYDPTLALETPAPTVPPRAPAAGGGATPPAPQPAVTFDAGPGAELRGLKTLGILVEDLSAQAKACGLNHDAIEAALSKRLTDGGFTVRTNSDEDTYVYVNVMTTTVAAATCVSRYDAFLYTHATANLSYRDRPVLVQVSLMHRGGIGTSAPTAHAAAVIRGLEEYVGLFVTQIRDANK